MAIEITVPRLGWSMDEGAFAGWLRQHGEVVTAGEALFAVESDKVTMDVESLDSGTLHIPPEAPQPGDVVRVGQLLGFLLTAGEPAPVFVPATAAAPAPSVPGPATKDAADLVVDVEKRRRPVTPRARRVAAELGVDVREISGTGRAGRVREADIRAAQTLLGVSPTRRTIAARMMESRAKTAPVTLTSRADATGLVAMRQRASYTAVLVKLAAEVLTKHPMMAARWLDDRRVVPVGKQIDIGVAVDVDHGLVVPVLRDATRLTFEEASARLRSLSEKARQRRLRPDEMEGAVFTVTNLGAYGVDAFTPILHYPQAAILGVGAIRLEPVALPSGEIAAGHRITLSLTFDHRVVDGGPAARFLQELVGRIESLA